MKSHIHDIKITLEEIENDQEKAAEIAQKKKEQ